MATSVSKKVLILGHSFVRRLVTDLRRECVDRAVETFNVSGVDVRLVGVGGRTVQKLRDYDLYRVDKCKPDILVLEISANDLMELASEVVGSALEDLVCLLHKTYGVKVIAVSASIHRQVQLVRFNHNADLLNQYLLEPFDFAFFFKYRGLHNPSEEVLLQDGVHLNSRGQYLLYRSYRGAILTAKDMVGT